MIIKINENKTLVKHISCGCKCEVIVIQVINGITINVNVSLKSIVRAKKIILGIIAHVFVRVVSIVEDSIIVSDKIIGVMDSTNVTNTVSTNITSTLSKNSDDKKVRYKMDCNILHTFLLIVILLFIIISYNHICYHYAKNRSKKYWNIKIGENNEVKTIGIKNRAC